ncbi:MAG: FAD-binding oxidoreductase [Acidimicrobiales bacterium]
MSSHLARGVQVVTEPVGPSGAERRERLEAALGALGKIAGLRVETSPAVRERHSRDESHHRAVLPGAVVFCESTEQVAAVAAACSGLRVPMVAFGTGTGLEGGAVGSPFGVSLVLSGMQAILRVSPDDMDAEVEAGVTQVALNRRLRADGLFFPVDPGAEASLGGMAATGASGTTTVRYGPMRHNVLGLTVVLAGGEVVCCGGRARKSAAGYDLVDLFLGSEGTLGFITELTLRLYGVPEATVAAACSFGDLESAVGVVTKSLLLGLPLSRIELVDDLQVDALNRYRQAGLAPAHHLFVELSGSQATVGEQASQLAALVEEAAGGFRLFGSAGEQRELWDVRHDALLAARALRPGARTWSTDVCVPLSQLAACIAATRKDLEESGCLAPIAGHVGDGNFHLAFVLDPSDDGELRAAEEVHDRLVRRALAGGGTCTGEHGIGTGKLAYLEQEFGAGIEVMRAIKVALDPEGLLNPGKVLREVLPRTVLGPKGSADDGT